MNNTAVLTVYFHTELTFTRTYKCKFKVNDARIL